MPSPTRIRQLFAEAVDLPKEMRENFLKQNCGDDPEVLAAVRSLLDANDSAGRFLAEPVIDPRNFNPPLTLVSGTRIGPYTIIRLLGEGGHGAVYLAQQEAPVQRRIALKLIKPGMDTREILARFSAERQVLALMQHSNIARVFDAGSTPSGHPFFAMEYVDGPTITEYCRHLPIRQRLELFSSVCMAVQYAHQKGIIHRDLKPANILIATEEGKASPKIIDFGIAKILQTHPDNQTVLTTHGQFLGTPQYMSPEQAGAAPDVDTRTDIYALGAILYELLVGAPAFEPSSLRSAAAHEITRIIRQIDPPYPSDRLRKMSQTTLAGFDSRSARKAAQRIRGELDWIVMRSMDKDRTRRYETADSLASDIQRFLNNQPVLAGPPSAFYRFSKFARRNRALLGAVSLIIVSLAVSLVIAVMSLSESNKQRDIAIKANQETERARKAEAEARARAEASLAAEADARASAETALGAEALARAKAEAESGKLFYTQKFLYRILSKSDQTPPVEVLDYAAAKVLEPEFEKHPEVRGPVHSALGQAYASYRLYDQSLHHHLAAAVNFRMLGDSEGLSIASAANNAAFAMLKMNRADEAEPLLRDSLMMYVRTIPQDKMVYAPVMLNLAAVTQGNRKFAESNDFYQRVITIYRQHKPVPYADLLRVMEAYSQSLEDQGKIEPAMRVRLDAEKVRSKISATTKPDTARSRP